MIYLKKIGLLLAYLPVGAMGVFGYFITLGSLNLPYLLKVSENLDYALALIFAIAFVLITAVSTRVKRCFEEDLFLQGEKWLLVRIVTSRDWVAEQILITAISFICFMVIGITAQANFLILLPGCLVLTLGLSLLFAVVNTVLWLIAHCRADRKRKRIKQQYE